MPPADAPTYEELPDTLWSYRLVPLWMLSLEAGEPLLSPPPPMAWPAHYGPSERAECQNLAQWRQRTAVGYRKSMGNLLKTVPMSTPETSAVAPVPDPGPDGRVPAVVTAALPPGGTPSRHKIVKGALTKLEYEVYVETWNEWMKSHPDFSLTAEDINDVDAICWETVQQHRLRLFQFARPKEYKPEEYHNSTLRMQRARENLSARRADRVVSGNRRGGSGSPVVNIALMSGMADPSARTREVRVLESSKEQEDFFEKTMSQTENPLALEPPKRLDPSNLPAAPTGA